MKFGMEYKNQSKNDFVKLAKELATSIKCGDILLMYGNLGAGKTYFTNKLCTALGVKTIVNSPSYVLLNEYVGKWNIYHYDLYRLNAADEVIELGIIERLNDGITIVEWPELIDEYLPKKRIEIHFEHNNDKRNIKILNKEG
jgi:tRNA threonylcarbamoyladenosine biosynthesis protein TsaE